MEPSKDITLDWVGGYLRNIMPAVSQQSTYNTAYCKVRTILDTARSVYFVKTSSLNHTVSNPKLSYSIRTTTPLALK